MRTAAGFVLVALLLAVPTAPRAHAEDAPKKVDAVGAVARLERAVDAGDSTWENLYDLYVKAKEAMAEEKDEAVKTEAETAYAAIRGKVAKALERDHLPMNGWFMGIFAALLLWGGFGWCLRIAMKSTPQHELDEDESWPIRPEEP
jgi:hypothetical protein